jgi:D-3-phosphoglycerate dehydrogenase
VNSLFAENNINITAQSLMTKGDIGYLVMDVDGSDSTRAFEKLQSVNGTMRVRVLY